MRTDGHIIHNKKRYPYQHGGCGQAVYIFEDAAQHAKWADSYDDNDAFVIVPDEPNWPKTAKAAIAAIKRKQKKELHSVNPAPEKEVSKPTVAQRIVKFIYG